MARMPSCAAGDRMFITPASVNIEPSAVDRKKMVTSMSPAAAPSSGRRITRVARDAGFSRSSDEAGSTADGLISMAGRLVSAMTGLLAHDAG